MEYPFGFEGFEDEDLAAERHPSDLALQTYSHQAQRSFREIDRENFVNIETHLAKCDGCLMALIRGYPDTQW
jgi:hypothetical protein